MSDKPAISFIGLGAMGFGMATHLVKQGYSVRGFDAYGPTLERFSAAGGEPSSSVAACIAERPVCIVMVATAAQAEAALLEGASPAILSLPHNASLLLCSTVPAAYVRSLEASLTKHGRSDIQLVDSPVSGGAGRAANGTLSIMAGGSEGALAAANPILRELSAPAKLYAVAGGIGAGSNMKMCHQVLAACQILGASEALGFAARIGLDAAAVVPAVLEGQGWSWMFEHRAPRIVHPDFKPVASALAIITKDTAIITSEARTAAFPVTLAAAAEQAYLAGLDRGWAADDDAGAARLYLPHGTASVAAAVEAGPKDADPEKVQLVVKLMRAINTLAAAEALTLAKAVDIDLQQLHDLSVAAAGGSWVLREGAGVDMLALLAAKEPHSQPKRGQTMGELVKDLQAILDEAAKVKCPLYLANTVYGVATSVLRGAPAGDQNVTLLLRHYTDVGI